MDKNIGNWRDCNGTDGVESMGSGLNAWLALQDERRRQLRESEPVKMVELTEEQWAAVAESKRKMEELVNKVLAEGGWE